MAERLLLRRMLRRWQPSATALSVKTISTKATCEQQCCYNTSAAATDGDNYEKEKNNQWLILPPFAAAADGCSIGKRLYGLPDEANTTALKWIIKCCPHLPRSLVQKLFRLRQVRKECSNAETNEHRPRRDSAIIAINKPPGIPVQGGCGIKRSLDELAAKYLKYDYMEPPRLVHRLDRDSSGILVMGRTQLSTTVLHSIFREKTIGVSNDILSCKKILQKRYLALVIGSPRRRRGLISVPLVKVVIDNGKSERITVADKSHTLSGQHAVTEYRVIASSPSGYSWLELLPLTGRKHQLRVHCAEVLCTPIVGDYKYGRQAHNKLGHSVDSASDLKQGETVSGGSISDEHLCLHLHCKEMILPDISSALEHGNITDLDSMRIGKVVLNARMPAHMQRSWDLLQQNH